MAFFGDMGKKLGSAAGGAMEKGKELAEVTKLNASISAKEKDISKLFEDMGEILFESEANNPESPVAEQCAKVFELKEEIEELKDKISQIKGSAGVKSVESAPAAGKFCTNCGAEIQGDSKFCPSCGQPL